MCWLKGHKPEFKERKRQRFTRWGETGTQYETVIDTLCSRCGAWQHPYRGDWITNP